MQACAAVGKVTVVWQLLNRDVLMPGPAVLFVNNASAPVAMTNTSFLRDPPTYTSLQRTNKQKHKAIENSLYSFPNSRLCLREDIDTHTQKHAHAHAYA